MIPVKVRENYKNKEYKQLMITIPMEIRKQFNIQKGDTLLLVANEHHVMIYTKEQVFEGLKI